jgi:hypothetical protein
MASSQPQGCHKIVRILREIFVGFGLCARQPRSALGSQKRLRFYGFCVLRGQSAIPAYFFKVIFWARQFQTSPTHRSFSVRQSMALTMPNSFGSLPAFPNFPTI